MKAFRYTKIEIACRGGVLGLQSVSGTLGDSSNGLSYPIVQSEIQSDGYYDRLEMFISSGQDAADSSRHDFNQAGKQREIRSRLEPATELELIPPTRPLLGGTSFQLLGNDSN